MKNLIYICLLAIGLGTMTSCRPTKYFMASNTYNYETGRMDIDLHTITKAPDSMARIVERLNARYIQYDTTPEFRIPHLKQPAQDYDSLDYNTFAVYTQAHTVASRKYAPVCRGLPSGAPRRPLIWLGWTNKIGQRSITTARQPNICAIARRARYIQSRVCWVIPWVRLIGWRGFRANGHAACKSIRLCPRSAPPLT